MQCVNGRSVESLEEFCEAIVASTKYVRIDIESDIVVIVNLNSHKKSNGVSSWNITR